MMMPQAAISMWSPMILFVPRPLMMQLTRGSPPSRPRPAMPARSVRSRLALAQPESPRGGAQAEDHHHDAWTVVWAAKCS
jgi:hypothetical protein